ncbi:MAG: PAC2 family protein [Desulfobacterota bacterium]|nr:PAC2 family protein [Thermodesulfobacteriota bacterium]
MERDLFKVDASVDLHHPPLLVIWQGQDIGQLCSKGIDDLIKKLGGIEVGALDPVPFFSFGGVRFKDDLVQIQESKFWALKEQNLLIFKSDEPEFEHHRFLTLLLEVAQNHFQTPSLYTINGMHTAIGPAQARKIWAVFNEEELREEAREAGLEPMTYHGVPALSSYLLWIAKQRRMPGMSLWLEVPFYFGTRGDYRAIQSLLSFLNRRFDLRLDLDELDQKIGRQEERIARLRLESEEIDGYLDRLERGEELDKEEQLKLAQAFYGVFWD